MNSEELEQSLRTEFEIYLKGVLVDMRQEMTDLQEQITTEFEKHKSQLDGVFRDFAARVQTDKGVDDVFKETVVEHLRLARDEGARITATAIAEAEDMEKDAAPKAGINELSAAIEEITEQTSQAAILKTLVNHAAHFTPRGAFFIIKNEHFVGWRVFGKESSADEQTVREVFFPVATATVLGESVRSLSAVESSYGTYSGDSNYLTKLEFGHPDKMFAVPLVARGRGVAVLYADYGTEGESVNIEALKTLVKIAGLTVELLAASPATKQTGSAEHSTETQESRYSEVRPSQETENTSAAWSYNQPADNKTADYSDSYADTPRNTETFNYSNYSQPEEKESYSQPEEIETKSPHESDGFSYKPVVSEEAAKTDYSSADNFADGNSFHEDTSDVQTTAETPSWSQPAEKPAEVETPSWNQPAEDFETYTPSYGDHTETQDFSQSYQQPVAEHDYSAPVSNDYQPISNDYHFEEEQKSFESPSFDQPVHTSSAKDESYDFYKTDEKTEDSFSQPAESVVSPTPVKARFSDRNVDLPIEVSEEERRLHNDARRFARLLVSEIKLYNEQKVKEGRDASDLYDRLREAIDRSREMYDKRVQPPVAAKFDYFHYELVNTLAEGDDNKLGGDYPGATV